MGFFWFLPSFSNPNPPARAPTPVKPPKPKLPDWALKPHSPVHITTTYSAVMDFLNSRRVDYIGVEIMNNDGVRVFLREGAYTAAQIEALNQRLKEVMHMIGMHASVRDANDAGKRYRMAFKGMRNMEHEKIRRTKEHVDGMMREREMEEIRRLEQSVKERKKLLRERERRRK